MGPLHFHLLRRFVYVGTVQVGVPPYGSIQIMIILSDTDTNADKFIKVPGI